MINKQLQLALYFIYRLHENSAHLLLTFHVAPNIAARLEQLESRAVCGGPGRQRDGARQVASDSAVRAHRQVHYIMSARASLSHSSPHLAAAVWPNWTKVHNLCFALRPTASITSRPLTGWATQTTSSPSPGWTGRRIWASSPRATTTRTGLATAWVQKIAPRLRMGDEFVWTLCHEQEYFLVSNLANFFS